MRCGSCGMNVDVSGALASGTSCPGCGTQLNLDPGFAFHGGQRIPASGAPPLTAGGWGGRPRYRIGSSITDILEGTFRVWGQSLIPNGLLGFLPTALSIPFFIAFAVLFSFANHLFDSQTLTVSMVVLMFLIPLLAYFAAYLGSFVILDDTVRQQGDENIVSAFATGVRRLPAAVLSWMVLSFGLFTFYFLPSFALATVSPKIGFLVCAVLSIPVMVVSLRVSVALPAMMIEELGPIDAVVRSFQLTRGHGLTLFVASIAVGGFTMFIGLFLMVASWIPLVGFFASIFLMVLVNTLVTAFSFTCFAGLRDADENERHGEV